MPHLEYDREALDTIYPSIVAAQDIPESDEAQWDTWDKILLRGEEIVQEIRARTISDGRRRWHTSTAGSSSAAATAGSSSAATP